MEHASLGFPLNSLELNQQEADAAHTLKKQLADHSTHGKVSFTSQKNILASSYIYYTPRSIATVFRITHWLDEWQVQVVLLLQYTDVDIFHDFLGVNGELSDFKKQPNCGCNKELRFPLFKDL